MEDVVLKNKFLKKCFFPLIVFFGLLSVAFAGIPQDKLPKKSFWVTVDDHTGKELSVVEIDNNKVLSGHVVKIFPVLGHKPSDRCVHCAGAQRNKPILGMRILWDMQWKDGLYAGGKILDPSNGKTYRCHLSLADRTEKLDVRGYIGIPLLGRTQTWLRVHPVNKTRKPV